MCKINEEPTGSQYTASGEYKMTEYNEINHYGFSDYESDACNCSDCKSSSVDVAMDVFYDENSTPFEVVSGITSKCLDKIDDVLKDSGYLYMDRLVVIAKLSAYISNTIFSKIRELYNVDMIDTEELLELDDIEVDIKPEFIVDAVKIIDEIVSDVNYETSFDKNYISILPDKEMV